MPKNKPEPLWVDVNQDGEGYTYSLFPPHEARVRASYPHAQLAERLFLSQDVKQDFATTHERMAPMLLQLLTQLSLDELKAIGPWEFRRPNKTSDLLFTWPSVTASESTSQNLQTKKTTVPSPKSPRSGTGKAAG